MTARIAERTHLFWSRTSSWSKQMRSLRRLRPCLSWNSKHWSNWFSGSWSNHGAWLDHESLLLILKLIVDRPCTRMSMDIRVHIGRNPRSQHEGREPENFINFISLTINAPLIVKDEVDKVFELILFATKQKFYVGLKAYCCFPCPLKGPGTGGPWLPF